MDLHVKVILLENTLTGLLTVLLALSVLWYLWYAVESQEPTGCPV